MIKKTYKSNTDISINVVLPSNKNLHVSFTALSNGSSLYTTDNEDVQAAIERHYKYGKLFKLHNTEESTAESAAAAVTATTDTESESGEGAAKRQVTVSDLGAAKDYLADTYGISRTVLRSRKAIEEQAAARGIEFVGLT